MKNVKSLIPLVLLGLLLAGCSYNESLVPEDETAIEIQQESLMKSAKNHFVPFKSKFICWTEPITPETPDEYYHQAVYGNGNASHMGKTVLLIEDEPIDVSGMPWTTEDIAVVLTAANGDELWFTYSSSFDPSPFFEVPPDPENLCVVHGEGPITGGTGRFEGASGTMAYDGDWNPESGLGDCTFTGKIKF